MAAGERSGAAGRVVVVGGGVAAHLTATELRRLGHAGEVLVLSGEGEAPYDRTTLSKSVLSAGGPPPALAAGGAYHDAEVEVRTGTRVTAVDLDTSTVATAAGERIGWRWLVLATGARCRQLSLPGATLPGVHELRELADAARLRAALRPGARLVVIGGGLIGLEVAASASTRGCAVTVVEVAPALMSRVLPAAVADALQAEHAARGVDVLTGVRPVALESSGGRVAAVALADGRSLPADAVLVAVGITPRTELAEAAGLPVDDGVVVDASMATAADGVLAAGDVARVVDGATSRRYESWNMAGEQARVAAATITGGRERLAGSASMWSDQYDLFLKWAGEIGESTTLLTRGAVSEPGGLLVLGVEDGRLVAVFGLARGTGGARAVRAGQALIDRGVPVEADQLLDPDLDLRQLLKRSAS